MLHPDNWKLRMFRGKLRMLHPPYTILCGMPDGDPCARLLDRHPHQKNILDLQCETGDPRWMRCRALLFLRRDKTDRKAGMIAKQHTCNYNYSTTSSMLPTRWPSKARHVIRDRPPSAPQVSACLPVQHLLNQNSSLWLPHVPMIAAHYTFKSYIMFQIIGKGFEYKYNVLLKYNCSQVNSSALEIATKV
eukprot:Gb_32812 [translate_table: standard]